MYWDSDPVENVFLEVTDRDNIGGDLLAPVHARGGKGTGGYVLVPHVKTKDVVVHYDSGGRSDCRSEPRSWQSRA